ncbi:hypothetical protein [uncultured Parasutterella sp.]|uniref:hypothetical protein n=1 Tax=uncultured Parasutterella sp. TaxID=1263098 RepID=UPI00272DA737|nr:hypothetical protein [uncultured Parasutterella sp.]
MINMMTGKWITSPGDVAQDAIEDGIIERNRLRDALDLGEVEFASLLSGELSLSPLLARKLALALGGTSRFWENLEKQYRKERNEHADSLFCAPVKVSRIPKVYKGLGCYAYS